MNRPEPWKWGGMETGSIPRGMKKVARSSSSSSAYFEVCILFYTGVYFSIQSYSLRFSSRVRACGGGGTISAHDQKACSNAHLFPYLAPAAAAAVLNSTTLIIGHFFCVTGKKSRVHIASRTSRIVVFVQLKVNSLVLMFLMTLQTFLTNPQAC